MRTIEGKAPLPKGIRKFIWEKTDIRTNVFYHTLRYIITLEMWRGKPLKRVFAFNATKKNHDYKDIRIKEVARYYDGKQYLGCIDSCLCGKRVYWDHEDYFYLYKRTWTWWYSWYMYDARQFLAENGFTHTGWEECSKDLNCDLYEHLNIYLKHPKIELLAKAGLGRWIAYIRNLDTTKKSLPEIFKIRPEAVELLKNDDFGYKELMACRALKTADMRLIRKEVETRDRICERNRNLEYLTRYASKELKAILKERKTHEYIDRNMVAPSDYVNYLEHLQRTGAITDRKRIYPEDFHAEHQKAIEERIRMEQKAKAEKMDRQRSGFAKNYRKHKRFIYGNEALMIYPVSKPEELIEESNKLVHCVRTYADNVAAGTTEIMLIRTAKKPDEPYYTLELKGKRVVQVRGKRNKMPTKNVRAFVKEWAALNKLTWDQKQAAIAQYNAG